MKKVLSILLFAIVSIVSVAQVQYNQGGVVSSVNSTVATLTSGSVFTGTSEDISKYVEIRVSVKADVASATDGLSIQQSRDGSTWSFVNAYTIPAATGKEFGIGRGAKFFRVVYTNGGTNQATFELTTTYFITRTKPSSVRPQDARTNDNDMEEVLNYSMAYDPNTNTWNRVAQDLYFTGQAAQTATVNNIIPSTVSTSATDLLGYKSGMIQIIAPAGTYTTGAIIFEGSNDSPTGTNFQTIPVWNQVTTTGTPITAAITLVTTTSIGYTFPINFRYIRVRISTAVSGASASVQAISTFSKAAWTPTIFQIAQATAANLNTTIGSGTITTVTTTGTVTTLANGQTAHSSASTGSPLRTGGRVLPSTPDLTLVSGDASDIPISVEQQLIDKPYAPALYDWSFACTAPVANTTDVVLKAAAGASIRNYVTGCQIINASSTIATEVVIKDGSTVIWRGYVGVGTVLNSAVGFTIPSPLRGTANTALNFACITTASSVYVNCQGYIAP